MRRLGYLMLAAVWAPAVAGPTQVGQDVPTAVTAVSSEQLEALSANRSLESVLATLRCSPRAIPSLAPPASPDPLNTGRQPRSLTCLQPDDLRMVEIYNSHNAARALYGSQPLVWDPLLARGAVDHAQRMSVIGLVHAPREDRVNIRENLLQSLRGGRSPGAMVAVWTDESRFFRPGVFPDVSTTGSWSDIAHYTQIIWPTTTLLGCGIHSDDRFDWTVCRYSPPGNRDGSSILLQSPALTATDTGGTRQAAEGTQGGSVETAGRALGMFQVGARADTANDEAPATVAPRPTADMAVNIQGQHPLVPYFRDAEKRAADAIRDCKRNDALAALKEMEYAAAEMRKLLARVLSQGPTPELRPQYVADHLDRMDAQLKRVTDDIWNLCP